MGTYLDKIQLRQNKKRVFIAIIVFVVLFGYGHYKVGYLYINQEIINGLRKIDANILLDNVMKVVKQNNDEYLVVKTNKENGGIIISHTTFAKGMSKLDVELFEKETLNVDEYYTWAWYERYRTSNLKDSQIISIGKKAYFTWNSKYLSISYVGYNDDYCYDTLDDQLKWLIKMGT